MTLADRDKHMEMEHRTAAACLMQCAGLHPCSGLAALECISITTMLGPHSWCYSGILLVIV